MGYGLCCPALCWIADAQELRIQAAKHSEIGSDVPLGLLFADGQESRIQIAKRLDTGSTAMKGFRFAVSKNLCFQAWKRS